MGLASLLGRNTSDDVGAVVKCLLGMEGSLSCYGGKKVLGYLLASEALYDDFGVLVDSKVFYGVIVRKARG